MKEFIYPMLAHIGTEKDLTRKNAIFEPKLDGIRALCYVNKSIKLFSRNKRDITAEYPELDFSDAFNVKSAIFDGEIVVLDPQSSPRFHLWQQGLAAQYIIFDILMLNGKMLLDVPLLERKKILEETVTQSNGIDVIFYTSNGEALWKEMLKRDMEGVIVKGADSLYYPGVRAKAWLKVKAYKTLDALIIGYTQGRRQIASLALGIYESSKELRYIGKVGTGLSDAFLKGLLPELQKRVIDKPAVKTAERNIIWVQPELVCEIKYLEFTNAMILRAPVFIRLRPDKNPQEITFNDQDIKF